MTSPERARVVKVDYKGWQNCYRLSNEVVDLILTTDVGPRVIRFGFVGGENEFKECTDMADPRWTWGSEYVILRQDPEMEKPQMEP